ncbi:hypothetical protein DACRYDRAFT_19810 [Dacryopinax primogenitus]|uniref:Uncharacterized protein n=1 Tax=Dacryopinax primogenitus (strain DJM 731) TaxID=1858805 RepID=M5GA83_DACPD|nr:uncharacterized protein DACRYDRAFT_19810 [Dacryopinax primogenitus]EJU05235.1 hypothetical protein DACRYDRAFT_19810 [Dacryopinax primogenitus]
MFQRLTKTSEDVVLSDHASSTAIGTESVSQLSTSTAVSKRGMRYQRAPSSTGVVYTSGYADQFVCLSVPEGTLVVYNFLLPMCSVTIPLSEIISLVPASTVSSMGIEPCGLSSCSGIGWARDWRRALWSKRRREAIEAGSVVKWKGGWCRVGFSTVEPVAFARIMREAGVFNSEE